MLINSIQKKWTSFNVDIHHMVQRHIITNHCKKTLRKVIFLSKRKSEIRCNIRDLNQVSILSIFAEKLEGKTQLLSGRHFLKSLAFKRPIDAVRSEHWRLFLYTHFSLFLLVKPNHQWKEIGFPKLKSNFEVVLTFLFYHLFIYL